jgi:molybdate transport system ATP-binding protein
MENNSTGKVIAIAGLNGSGKTRYVEQMRRQIASDSVRYIAFCDTYGAQTDRAYYLQLRWNQHDIDAETPTVQQTIPVETAEKEQWRQRLVEMMGLEDSMDKYIIQLSSGELRKLQLAKTLLSRPKTLIVDNPFIGLDSGTRTQLKELLRQLATSEHIIIYIVVARPSDIPDYVDEVVWITPREEFMARPAEEAAETEATPAGEAESKAARPDGETADAAPPVVEMRHVTISYGSHTILRDINWTIREGERWALTGPNGSGKSTLLSLICADNPQAYACDISLFGRQRGTGETIWDIKRRIGYVSPEMHRSYRHNLPAEQIVASGLKDTVGLYTRANEQEREQCRRWMAVFGLQGKERQPFLTLSSGEQRLVLLARAFVKDPDLLILDEPMHGLDDHNQQKAKEIIEKFCQKPGKTLIMVSHYEEELPPCINRRMTMLRV